MTDNTQPVDANSLYGSDTESQPQDADSLYGADSGQPSPSAIPNSGSYSDLLYSSSGLKGLYSIAKAFGHSSDEAWGSISSFPHEMDKELTKAGLFNDYTKGNTSILKSANEAWMRPAIAGITAIASPVIQGFAGLGGALAQTSEVTGGIAQHFENQANPGVTTASGEPVTHLGTAGSLAAKALGFGFGVASEVTGLLPSYLPEAGIHIPEMLTEGRANASIGETEGQYFGTKEPTPEQELARAHATGNLQPITGTPPDIHSVARQIAPETFQDYDNLTAQRDNLRQTLQGLSENRPVNPEFTKLQDTIDKYEPLENKGKITNTAQDRLNQARADLEKTPQFTDTPEMTQVREDLLKADISTRDLAPDVSAAYRLAQEHLGTDSVESPKTEPASQEPVQGETEGQEGVGTTEEVKPASDLPRASEGISTPSGISEDVTKKLTEAGRPLEEAEAAGKLIEAHYEARAARFSGKLGTAKELYDKEFPDIKQAISKTTKENVNELNQSGLRVARKLPDGSIKIGEPGQIHFELWDDPLEYDKASPSDDGFATPDGEFLGRVQAAKWVHDNELQTYRKLITQSPDFRSGLSLESVRYDVSRGLKQGKRGSLTINKGRNVLRLFKDADASTFFHETGHQWLEELIQDSKHEEAPEELKSDAETVRTWLKNDGGDITRAQHEKFARGFERYLMEGVSPNKELAGIFTKFKEWLSKIYKSVSDLKSPINDNIRNVFDRLISNDNKTVIAPDREPLENEPTTGGTESSTSSVSSETTLNGKKTTLEELSGNTRQPDPGVTYGQTFVDKAGNIDLTNITSDGDLRQAIREVIEHYSNDEFLKARRGVVSTQDTLDLADTLAENPKRIDQALRTVSGQFTGTPLSSLVFAIKKLMLKAANDIKEAVASDDVEKFVDASEKLTRFTETFSGITAEWGRTGQMLKGLNPEMEESQALQEYLAERTGKTFNQIKQEMKAVGKLDSANKITGFIKDTAKPSFGQMITEAFKNWLISGPITHGAYTVGTELFSLYRAIPEKLTSALVSKVHDLIPGANTGPKIFAREALEGAYGLTSGHIEGIKAAWDSFKMGQTSLLPNEERADTGFTNTKAIPGILGSIVRIPGERLVAPLHSFNRTVSFFVERNSLIARQAMSEGLTGKALADRIAELKGHVPVDITVQSRKIASEGALMGKPGVWTKKAVAFLHHEIDLPILGRTAPGNFIAPFITVTSNINRLALLERSPLGLASKLVRDDLSGQNGRLAQDTAVGKMALGTSIGIGVGSLYLNKQINPAAPSDYKHAVVDQMVNGLPYGVRVGDMSYDVTRLGVLGTNISMAVDMAAFGKDLYDAKKDEDYKNAGVAFVHSVSSHFLDQGYLSGISDLMKAVTESDRYGDSWTRNFISTAVVPFSIGSTQVAQRIDPYERDTRTITDAVKARIPFESETLHPRIDIFGQPVPNKEYYGVYSTQVSNDPAWLALKNKGFFPAPVKRDINGIQLNEAQYEDYARKSGVLFKMLLMNKINKPGFNTLSAGTQHELISTILASARKQAADSVKAESVRANPQDNLVTKANAAKRALRGQ